MTPESPSFAEFRATTASTRRGAARVFSARSLALTGPRDARARLVLLTPGNDLPGAAEVLRSTQDYASGLPEFAALLGSDWLRSTSSAGQGASELVIAYAATGSTTLDDELARGPLVLERCAQIVEGIAAGLAGLHDQGVAHGHLRADLIALGQGGEVRIEGFGVAQVALALGGPQYARDVLPPEYRAPELSEVLPARPTPASDVYALAVLAREMVANSSQSTERVLAAALDAGAGARPAHVRRWAADFASAIREQVVALPTPSEPSEPSALPVELPPSVQPTAAPQPVEVEAPSLSQAPGAQRVGASLWIILALLAGALLMCGGIGALFAYRVRAASRFAVAHPTGSGAPSAPAASSPLAMTPAPPPTGSAQSAPDAPDGDESEPEPVAPPKPPSRATPSLARGRLLEHDATAPMPLSADVPLLGSPDALVTVVVFGDLQCPHTRKALATVLRLKALFKDDLRLAFRHRPLPKHESARAAAEILAALHARAGNDAAWSFLERASRSSAEPRSAELERWLGSEHAPLTALLEPSVVARAAERVDRDLQLAALFDVRMTPTLFVNGLRIEGARPYTELRQAIEAERNSARQTANMGVPAAEIYATRTRKNLINVGPDIVERMCPKVAGSPARGSRSALVTVVEFSDFECEYCKRVQPTLASLLASYAADVRLVWKNFPLEQHENARAAAALAMHVHAARGEASFWKIHDALFASTTLDQPRLVSLGVAAGVTRETVAEVLARAERDTRVNQDATLGEKLGVSGTPTFFVNGRKLSGAQPAAEFKKLINDELGIARRLVTSGTAPEDVYGALCGSPGR